MSNEILPFGIGAGANVIPYADYEALAARAGGFVSGVARSEQLNTVWRQSSFVASVLAQFIANRSGQNVLDDGDTAKLLNNLELAIKTYANNNLPAASITTVGITKLSSETNSSSEVLAATPKAVKSLSDATLKTANNLSEIKLAGPAAVASAVDNLGLTEAAAAAANALKKSANLSDLIDKPLARSNLGVTAASLTNAGLVRLSDNVGSTDTTLAATINSVTYTFGQAQSKMSK
ncbi:phage tail protein, partial [Yersinia ruckeri]|uniref:phage tail protein n=4 Tax=Yersinia ruckeri TaxID=29486 RepID=UPI00223749CC